jgi:hypothetical protein
VGLQKEKHDVSLFERAERSDRAYLQHDSVRQTVPIRLGVRRDFPAGHFLFYHRLRLCQRAGFSVDLINSKYRWYRYDLVWQKNNKVGFLNANRMPMRNHEQVLVFGRPGFQKAATYNPQKIPGVLRQRENL